MKKTKISLICIILMMALIVSMFSGCSSNTDTQSSISDDVVIEQIIIEEDLVSSDSQNTVSNVESSQNVQSSENANSDVVQSSKTEASSENTTNNQESSQDSSTQSQTTESNCTHDYKEKIVKKAELFNMGEKEYTCADCGDNYTKKYCIEEIKILSISNSYGKNALWELYDICKMEGVKNIDIAVMYIAGCSLDKHWENIQNNKAEYEVFRNNNGSWTSTKNCTIDSLLAEGDWDIISTQNSSGLSGKEDGFNNLNNVADYIKNKCPNSKLVWHNIWGYQSGSEWLKPNTYNGDENFMFNSIMNCTNNIVIPSNKFYSVVPVGTAVMNARTSNLKNIVHLDDGSHLSEDFGYYIAALTWYCHITGASPYDTAFAASSKISTDKMNVVIESVKNAIENPNKVTQSYYTN